ncbi:MAG: ribosome recycling factor [Oceanicoccus sp.]|jgi:ribosome recycling factor
MTQQILQKAQTSFDGALTHLKAEFTGLQIGRASAGIVEGMKVDSYGVTQPLKAVASISVPDSKTVSIQPWDKSMLSVIEKAIQDSDLNLNPTNNGTSVILNIPPLTEERRRDLVKVVGRMAEEAKISVRNVRQDAMTTFKRLEHDKEITEDDRKRSEKELQEKVDVANNAIVAAAKSKEGQVMKI